MDLVSQNLLMTSGGKTDPTYIDDVFSTYLYTGTSTIRPVSNGIKLGNNNTGNSVEFSGSSGELEVASTSDFAFGTDPFTIEFWLYFQSVTDYCAMFEGRPYNGNGDYQTFGFAGGYLSAYSDSAYTTQGSTGTTAPAVGQWTHIALVREGTGTNQEKIYFNGTQVAQGTNATNIGNQRCLIAGHAWSRGNFNGHISNYRVVKGQAIYTSNFTPSTQALTTTSQGAIASNVKLLCCNKNIVTGSTVTPGTIDSRATSGTGGNPPTTSGFGPFTGTGGEGGMVWIKARGHSTTTGGGVENHALFDTSRGVTKGISSNTSAAEVTDAHSLTSFNSNGFSLGTGYNTFATNLNLYTYSSWTFRKQKGFFDIVTWTGNGVAGREIAHSLGSVPGCIMVKNLSAGYEWAVYHRSLGGTSSIQLSSTTVPLVNNYFWYNTNPTSTHFTTGLSTDTNRNGDNYVAYIFAGGASSAATARSVVCDGTGDYLSLGSSSDLAMGTGDFTIEGWYNINAKQNFGFFMNGPSGLSSTYGTTVWNYTGSTYGLQFFGSGNSYVTGFTPPSGQWFHLALVRNSGTTSLYYNGKVLKAVADNTNYTNTTFQIGGYDSSPYLMNGSVSNFRIVKGTAVYTSSFNPPTEPLTNITNTVLLCCNNSSTTGSTVTPGTITANGDPTASTDSPFDDPDGFKFGEEGDQNLIKCGSYIGNSTANHEIEIGWEPQWWLVKNVTGAQNWQLLDSMRGWVSNGNDEYLVPNNTSAESAFNFGNPTPTGFNLSNASSNWQNASGSTYVYIAIRRPDPLVAKPAEAGTDVFTMDTGNSSSSIPNFTSGFPVDFAFMNTPASTGDRYTGARLLGEAYVRTNSSGGWADWGGGFDWDSNIGWLKSTAGSAWQSWMWNRHAGFDVVTYEGNANNAGSITDLTVNHNLGRVPEMMWIKNLDSSYEWYVYHKGLNGGTNPQNYTIQLSTTNTEANDGVMTWQGKLPTSKAFTLGGHFVVNKENNTCLAMLFASVDGISKVGYYNGTGAAGHVITTGFLPRLLIIKTINGANSWFMYDSLRGLGAGADPYLQLENTNAQASGGDDVFATSSTGFTINQNYASVNASGQKYIYYAHA